MCNQLTKSGKRCLLAKNSKFCHIHKKNEISFDNEIQIQELKSEINKLIKKNDKLFNFQKNQKIEISNLYLVIEKKNKQLKEKDSLINLMKSDYEKYQIIIDYERNKKKLIDLGVDIYSYNNNEFHEKRLLRNKLAHLN